jgi:hypothetical protein
LVEFDTRAEVSEGIRAMRVQFLRPLSSTMAARAVQSTLVDPPGFDRSSLAALEARWTGRTPWAYLVAWKPSGVPLSRASSAEALISE